MSIDRLRRIAHSADRGEPLIASDAAWLRSVVERYERLAAEGLSLDRCAGLVPDPGGEPWWRAERRRERDTALRTLAARFHPGLPLSRCSAVIQTQLRRYESASWLLDRRHDHMPAHYVGTPKAYLFAALKAAPVPSSIRQIASILAGRDDEVGNQLGDFISNETQHGDSQQSEEHD